MHVVGHNDKQPDAPAMPQACFTQGLDRCLGEFRILEERLAVNGGHGNKEARWLDEYLPQTPQVPSLRKSVTIGIISIAHDEVVLALPFAVAGRSPLPFSPPICLDDPAHHLRRHFAVRLGVLLAER